MKKTVTEKILAAILCATMLLSASSFGASGVFSLKADAASSGPFKYEVYENSVYITDFDKSTKNVVVPETINGISSIYLTSAVLKKFFDITSIKLPSGFKGVLETVPTPEPLGIAFTDYELSNLENLESITVSGNEAYSSESGVLFNKDKSELICYPANKADKEYTIPNSVIKVERYAFNSCRKLTTLTIGKNVADFPARMVHMTLSYDEAGELSIIFESCFNSSIQKYAVKNGNKTYAADSQGVLYQITDAGWILYLYPYSSTMTTYTIPAKCSGFSGYTFDSNIRLKEIKVDPANKYCSIIDGGVYFPKELILGTIDDNTYIEYGSAFYIICPVKKDCKIPQGVEKVVVSGSGSRIAGTTSYLRVPKSVKSLHATNYTPDVILYEGSQNEWSEIFRESTLFGRGDRYIGKVEFNAYNKNIDTQKVNYGDLDNDGSINSSDALIVLQHSIGRKKLTGDRFICADVTKDGTVNSSDALKILQYSVGQIKSF